MSKNFIYTAVCGKRRRLKPIVGNKRLDIDMSYITDTVIAMSFPASTWKEKVFRNNID